MDQNDRQDQKVNQSVFAAVEPPKASPSHTRRNVLIGVLIALLILGLAGLWFIFVNNPEENLNSSQENQATNVPDISLEEVKSVIESSGVVVFSDEIEQYVNVPADIDSSYFANIIKRDETVVVDHEQIFANEEQTFSSKDFKKIEPLEKGSLSSAETLDARYQNDSLLCTLSVSRSGKISNDANNTEDDNLYEDITGGYIEKYCIKLADIETTAKAMKPFYDAYFADPDNKPTEEYTTLLGVEYNKIQKSVTPGYEYVTGGVGCVNDCGGAVVTFARETDGAWEFVLGQQDTANCEDYKTDVARKALADASCHDSKTKNGEFTTVGKYYNLL